MTGFKGKTRIVQGMVESDVRLDGKTVVITGCNTGIGYETVLDLAARGARIIMACRDTTKAETAKAKIVEQVQDAQLIVKKLDLASLQSVREFAKDVNETESRLDILINNAGVMMCPAWKTEDGFEMQMGTNHIGHFLLTQLLLDLVKSSASGRIIIVSSFLHKGRGLNWEDIMQEKHYDPLGAYQASKLANIYHCLELSKQLKGTGVTCNCLNPGIIGTNLLRHVDDGSHLSCCWRCMYCMCLPCTHLVQKSPRQGAQTIVYCAIAPELATVSGKYFSNCAETSLGSLAKNLVEAEKLWRLSEEWTRDLQAP